MRKRWMLVAAVGAASSAWAEEPPAPSPEPSVEVDEIESGVDVPSEPRETPPPLQPKIGVTKRFGVGIAAGFPTAATMKVYFDTHNAVSLHVGPTLVVSGLHLRLQFEQTPAIVTRWSWAELGVTWNLGTVVEFIFGEQAVDSGIRAALSAGAGVELRLVPVPLVAYAEVGPVLYPYELARPDETPFAPASFILIVGARWYF